MAVSMMMPGCSISPDIEAAERAVSRFHEQLNARQFEAIYDEAAEEFRKTDSKEQIVRFLQVVAIKLGPVQSKKLVKWEISPSLSGSNVVLSYETSFKEEIARENFVFKANGSRVELLTYNVQARALVLR
jgi:hypothetical protein